MSRIARQGASLLAVAVALVLIPIGVSTAWFALSAPTHAPGPATELRVALLRAGLGAEALAAAGLSAQETSAVTSAFSSAMASQPGALAHADDAFAAARAARDSLQRKVRSGLATEQEIADLASAKSAFSSAESARDHLIDGLFEDATAGLANAKVALLATIRSNAEHELPVEFLVKTRSESEWVALRNALSNERITAKYGDAPNAQMQAALTAWRSDATVAAAKSACNANLATIESTWSAATGG